MVFKSPLPDLDLPRENICDFMFPDGKLPSDKPLWIDADSPSHSLSPRAALGWLKRLGYGMERLGINQGDVCMIFTPNHIYVPVAYLGFVGYGASFSGSNPAYTIPEMVHQMTNTTCQLMFVHPELLPTALAAAKKAGMDKGRIFLFTDKFEQPINGVKDWRTMIGTEREGANWRWKKLRPEEAMTRTATVNFSSGTTGLSKGVAISHSNCIANAEQMRIAMSLSSSPTERWVGFLPLYHAYGQAMMILMATRLHIPVYVMRKFELLNFLRVIQTHKITKLQVVPPIMVMLDKRPEVKDYDLSSVKHVLCGAAPMSRELQDTISKRFGFFVMQAWGMTEVVNCGISNSPTGKNLGVGQLIPNTEIKLLDDDGNEVKSPNTKGEIHIRGPQVAMRYWRNEEATIDSFDNEGWFKTGDIAVVDEEGYFTLVDRKKELIKVNGLQVSPAELEAVLLENADVQDCGVVGITVHSHELPRAYIQLSSSVLGRVTEKDINNYMKERVASFKMLRGGIVFVEEVPRLASGKIMRKELRAWAVRDGKEIEERGGWRAVARL